MFFIPFPFVIAEIVIFVFSVQHWGFLNTLGFYFLPSLLGVAIISTVGRFALLDLQAQMMKGDLPGSRILHSGAIFISGLLFLIPSFFSRVAAVVLFLPGLRHLAVWRFKSTMAQRMAQGARGFRFGNGGFQYYEFRRGGTGFEEPSREREVHEASVLDVTPLKVSHEAKKETDSDNK